MKIINCDCPLTNNVKDSDLCFTNFKKLDGAIVSIMHSDGFHIIHYASDVDQNGNNLFELSTLIQNVKNGTLIPAQNISVATVIDPSTMPRKPFVIIAQPIDNSLVTNV